MCGLDPRKIAAHNAALGTADRRGEADVLKSWNSLFDYWASWTR